MDIDDAPTLGRFLAEAAARFGPNEALVSPTARWTYTDLDRQADRVAAGLIAAGVAPGDAVGVLMGNRPEAVAALFGTARAGAVAVLLSTFAPRPELADMLDRAAVTVALAQDRLLDRRPGDDLAAIAPELPALQQLAVVGTPSWDELLAAGDRTPAPLPTVDPDDDALVIFSSGTTDRPKGMVHGHRAATLQFRLQADIFGRHEGTRMWSALPLFWTAGLTAMGSTLAAGGCWVMAEVFRPADALATMARERVTEPYALPHQTRAMAEHPDWATTDLSSLTCAYGKSAYARHPTVTADPGWFMPVGYGLSEMCTFVSAHWSSTPREVARASSGRLLPGAEVRVVDPGSGAVLAIGEWGELAVRGPTRMHRYLGRAPAGCFDADGFFHTGDVGWIDGDGYLHFEGRRTEMIRTAGANVSPAEIEVQLRACPDVKLSRVLGMPDPDVDEVVVACIVPTEGAEAGEADIRAFLRERVSSYKVPRHVLFFAEREMPMTGSDAKVRDDALRALVAERLAAAPVPPGGRDR